MPYEDRAGLIEQVKSLENYEQFINFLDREMVDEKEGKWLVGMMDRYSEDYPMLKDQWDGICNYISQKEGVEITPTQIMIMRGIFDDGKHHTLKFLCDIFTTMGFSVRNVLELTPCEVCNAALPTLQMYNSLKSQNVQNLPPYRKSTCSTCV